MTPTVRDTIKVRDLKDELYAYAYAEIADNKGDVDWRKMPQRFLNEQAGLMLGLRDVCYAAYEQYHEENPEY